MEFEWEPCYRNDYPDFTCDETTELCDKLKTDLDNKYCCTFCDEPYEQCVSGEGLILHRKSFIKNIKAVISLKTIVINRLKVIHGGNGVLRKCRPGIHATTILIPTKKLNAKIVFSTKTTKTVKIYKLKLCYF